VTGSSELRFKVTNCDHLARLKFSPYLPYTFTEDGALMLADGRRIQAVVSRGATVRSSA
jgi:hypothetical protein